jgi:hypothetical protein
MEDSDNVNSVFISVKYVCKFIIHHNNDNQNANWRKLLPVIYAFFL